MIVVAFTGRNIMLRLFSSKRRRSHPYNHHASILNEKEQNRKGDFLSISFGCSPKISAVEILVPADAL
jgi:hypothetical protein